MDIAHRSAPACRHRCAAAVGRCATALRVSSAQLAATARTAGVVVHALAVVAVVTACCAGVCIRTLMDRLRHTCGAALATTAFVRIHRRTAAEATASCLRGRWCSRRAGMVELGHAHQRLAVPAGGDGLVLCLGKCHHVLAQVHACSARGPRERDCASAATAVTLSAAGVCLRLVSVKLNAIAAVALLDSLAGRFATSTRARLGLVVLASFPEGPTRSSRGADWGSERVSECASVCVCVCVCICVCVCVQGGGEENVREGGRCERTREQNSRTCLIQGWS